MHFASLLPFLICINLELIKNTEQKFLKKPRKKIIVVAKQYKKNRLINVFKAKNYRAMPLGYSLV